MREKFGEIKTSTSSLYVLYLFSSLELFDKIQTWDLSKPNKEVPKIVRVFHGVILSKQNKDLNIWSYLSYVIMYKLIDLSMTKMSI